MGIEQVVGAGKVSKDWKDAVGLFGKLGLENPEARAFAELGDLVSSFWERSVTGRSVVLSGPVSGRGAVDRAEIEVFDGKKLGMELRLTGKEQAPLVIGWYGRLYEKRAKYDRLLVRQRDKVVLAIADNDGGLPVKYGPYEGGVLLRPGQIEKDGVRQAEMGGGMLEVSPVEEGWELGVEPDSGGGYRLVVPRGIEISKRLKMEKVLAGAGATVATATVVALLAREAVLVTGKMANGQEERLVPVLATVALLLASYRGGRKVLGYGNKLRNRSME